MYNDVITLISKTASSATDEYGNVVRTTTTRDVFAKVESIGRAEFYQAAAQGFKPEIKFILADYAEYGDEQELTWNSKTYSVIRTYCKGQTIELVCYREVNNA